MQKKPVEFLYMETGSVLISHIISQRRINYLYEIVNRNDTELVKRIYTVQKDNPTKGDFVVLVEEDLRMIGEDPNNCNLVVLSKNNFKNHIKSEIRKVAFAEFKHVQESLFKVKEIPYNKLEYLDSEEFSNTECKLLFSIRSNLVKGLF